MKRLGLFACLLAVVWLSVPSGVVRAQDDPGSASAYGANVQITLEIIDSEPSDDRPASQIYKFVAREGGGMASMLMGWRVPIPTTQAVKDDDAEPVRQYVYQNIGVTAQLKVRLLPEGNVLVEGQIEASGVNEGPERLSRHTDGEMPIIATFQQAVNVILEEGKALRVCEVPDPDGGHVSLELQADVLD